MALCHQTAQAYFADSETKLLESLVADQYQLFISVVFRMNLGPPPSCDLGRCSTAELAPQSLTGRF